jgi:CDP-diacylglycerol--glycerol-3-phosphate 3-phosphatidyltransferase
MLTNLARLWGSYLIRPVARFLSRLGLTPNAVTVLGFAMCAAVAAVLATGRLPLAGALLIPTLAFDAVDGTMARMQDRVTRFGAFLDSTLDRWTELFLYSALVWHYLDTGQNLAVFLSVAAMETSVMVSYTRARAEGVGLPCKEGIFTRFERLVVLIVGLLSGFMLWALAIIAILAGITAIQRIFITYRTDQTTA